MHVHHIPLLETVLAEPAATVVARHLHSLTALDTAKRPLQASSNATLVRALAPALAQAFLARHARARVDALALEQRDRRLNSRLAFVHTY
jgi:hypothetical protein